MPSDELRTMDYFFPANGIIVQVDVPLESLFEPITFTTDGLEGPDGLWWMDFKGKAVGLPPGEHTLNPLTHAPRYRFFHPEEEPEDRRVFDVVARPEFRDVDEIEVDGLKLVAADIDGEVTVIGPTDYTIAHGRDRQPFALSLPRRKVKDGKPETLDGRDVLRYSDGGISNLEGKPAIQGKADYMRERDRTGMERD